jgi:hypothetical protein
MILISPLSAITPRSKTGSPPCRRRPDAISAPKAYHQSGHWAEAGNRDRNITQPLPLTEEKKLLLALLQTMRPRQWTKNTFVFVALIFDSKLFDLTSVLHTLYAFILLCLMSSAVYIMNDLADI